MLLLVNLMLLIAGTFMEASAVLILLVPMIASLPSSLGAVSRRVLPFLGVLLIDLLIITFHLPLTMWLAKAVVK